MSCWSWRDLPLDGGEESKRSRDLAAGGPSPASAWADRLPLAASTAAFAALMPFGRPLSLARWPLTCFLSCFERPKVIPRRGLSARASGVVAPELRATARAVAPNHPQPCSSPARCHWPRVQAKPFEASVRSQGGGPWRPPRQGAPGRQDAWRRRLGSREGFAQESCSCPAFFVGMGGPPSARPARTRQEP